MFFLSVNVCACVRMCSFCYHMTSSVFCLYLGFFSKLMALFHSFWNKEEIKKKCIHTKARRINVIPFQLQLFESREIWSSKLRTFLSARIANHISDIDMPPVTCRCTRHCHPDKIKGFLCGYTRIQLLKYLHAAECLFVHDLAVMKVFTSFASFLGGGGQECKCGLSDNRRSLKNKILVMNKQIEEWWSEQMSKRVFERVLFGGRLIACRGEEEGCGRKLNRRHVGPSVTAMFVWAWLLPIIHD